MNAQWKRSEGANRFLKLKKITFRRTLKLCMGSRDGGECFPSDLKPNLPHGHQ